MVAGRIATTAFLAPLIVTSPLSGVPPVITNFSKDGSLPKLFFHTKFCIFRLLSQIINHNILSIIPLLNTK